MLALATKLARVGGLDWNRLSPEFRAPSGCKQCNMTGYSGRTVMAEVLEVTPRIRAALSRNASTADLRAISVSEGMTTLVADGLRRAIAGKTSLAEVIKTLSPIYHAELG